jgi:predicted ATP-grasp superfamily ATP-dependent carboligase
MKLLVVGFSVRHIACSAARAGHDVIAADAFCDLDLERCTSEAILLNQDAALQSIPILIEKVSPDAVVLGPGLEEARVRGVRVLNNSPEVAARVSDKLWLARWLEERGFPFIKTQQTPSTDLMDFPMVVKPRKGAGGVGCRFVGSLDDLRWEDGLIIQECVEGRPASVSVIGNGREACAVATNEQLIGVTWAGAEGFRYSGNITPLEPDFPGLAEMAEEIISELRLVGSNGVDFLLTEKGPVVVEVNPRFQGSLDTVELSTGLNVFKAHLDSFQGILPKRPIPDPVPHRTAGRIIFYAPEDLGIGPKPGLSIEGLADIPRPGSLIKVGDPVASILATGKSRADVLRSLMDRATELRRALKAK